MAKKINNPTTDFSGKGIATNGYAENIYYKARNTAIASIIQVFADFITINAVYFLSRYLVLHIFGGDFFSNLPTDTYIVLSPVVLLNLLFMKLYPGYGIDPVEELKLTFTSITFGNLIIATIFFILPDSGKYSASILLICWFLTLFILPIEKSLLRSRLTHSPFWGIPVAVIGYGKFCGELVEYLKTNREVGLNPAIVVSEGGLEQINGIVHIEGYGKISELPEKFNIRDAIFAMPNAGDIANNELILKYSDYFSSALIIPDFFGSRGIWVTSRYLGGVLGFALKNNLLKMPYKLLKRAFDIIFTLILLIPILPLMLLISLIILIDSPGRIFFTQERVGQFNKKFNIIKFRTMIPEAEKKLKALLDSDPKIKEEFEKFHKLQHDPRITKFGRILRKYSLDELPQFFNVLIGDMSLIGPRAFVDWEMRKFSEVHDFKLKIKPGISGLWQISKAAPSSVEERMAADKFYINNWSIFLDFYITAKTIGVIFSGKNN